MREQQRLYTLTLTASLGALTLAFLSIQFLLPLAVCILLWAVPVIVAVQVRAAPLVESVLFGGGLLFVSFGMFGVSIGLWMAVYWLIGLIVGLAFERVGRFGRIILTTCTTLLTVGTLLQFFLRLAQIEWQSIQIIIQQVTSLLPVTIPPWPMIFTGLLVLSLIVAITIETTVQRIVRQLSEPNFAEK